MAGNISNTPLYIPNNPASHQEIYETYKVISGTKGTIGILIISMNINVKRNITYQL